MNTHGELRHGRPDSLNLTTLDSSILHDSNSMIRITVLFLLERLGGNVLPIYGGSCMAKHEGLLAQALCEDSGDSNLERT